MSVGLPPPQITRLYPTGPKNGGAGSPPRKGDSFCIVCVAALPSGQNSGRQHAQRLASGEGQERAAGNWLFCHFQLTQ